MAYHVENPPQKRKALDLVPCVKTIRILDDVGTESDQCIKRPRLCNDPHVHQFIGDGQSFLRSHMMEGIAHINISNASVIGKNAFADMCNVKSITLPITISELNDNAFENCSSLVDIQLPKSVKKIGYRCFYKCISLKKIDLSNVEELSHGCFSGCTSLADVGKISVVRISENAFENCSSLTEVKFSHQVKIFSCGAFSNSGLISVQMPSGAREVDISCFSRCKELVSFTFSVHITCIPSQMFWGCENLVYVWFHKIVSIGPKAFMGCKSLKKFKAPVSLAMMREGVFQNCESLEEVELSRKCKHIRTQTFAGCKRLQKITSYACLIEPQAFKDCSSLTHFDFSLVSKIEYQAFHGTGLKKIVLSDQDRRISSSAFSDSSIETIEYHSEHFIQRLDRGTFLRCNHLDKVIAKTGGIKEFNALSLFGAKNLSVFYHKYSHFTNLPQNCDRYYFTPRFFPYDFDNEMAEYIETQVFDNENATCFFLNHNNKIIGMAEVDHILNLPCLYAFDTFSSSVCFGATRSMKKSIFTAMLISQTMFPDVNLQDIWTIIVSFITKYDTDICSLLQ